MCVKSYIVLSPCLNCILLLSSEGNSISLCHMNTYRRHYLWSRQTVTLISLITGVLILEFPSSGTVSNKFSLPVSFQFYPFFSEHPQCTQRTLHQKSTATAYPWIAALQNWEKINSCCLGHVATGILLKRLWQANK